MKNSEIGLIIGGGLLFAGGGFLFIKNFYKHDAVEPDDYRTKTRKESKVKYPDPNNPIKFNIPEDYGIGHQRAEQLPDRSWYNRSDSTGGKRTKKRKTKKDIKKSKKTRK
jgi:hypothetical protein